MSVRPGVAVTLRSTPAPRSAPTDTGVWFVVGLADAGPAYKPTLVRSMADFERIFGQRVSYSILYDSLDLFFREGGGAAYVSRVVGPAAVTASKTLSDGAAGTSLTVTAIGPGSYGNNLKVGVRAGVSAGSFVIFVQDANGNEVESSPDLADNQAAVDWGKNSQYVRVALGASASDPAVAAAAAMTSGADDRNNITDTQWQAGLDAIAVGYGPGQVSMPGRTTSVAHLALLAHAATNRRVALLDAPDTATVSTLTAAVTADRAGGNQRYGAMFAPWVVTPGVLLGTYRTIPPSALIAGLLARNDLAYGQNQPAAGDLGISIFATDISQTPWSDANRSTLNSAGVNVIRTMFGQVRVYGWRSLVDAVNDPVWRNFGNSRLFMGLASEFADVAESFQFKEIDGQGRLIARFQGALTAVCQSHYNAGDLYGATPDEAFFIDVGSQVNTPQTLENNELHAVVNVKMSPFAEYTQIEVVKRPISEGVV